MLSLLTDAHISPSVAEQVNAKRPEIVINSLREWRGGVLLHEQDDVILTAALEDGLTLVTYDQRTIDPMIKLSPSQLTDVLHAEVGILD